MAKGNPFAKAGKGKGSKMAPPFGKGKDPDAAADAAGFKKGGKVKRK